MKSNQPFSPLAGLRDLIFRDFSVDNMHGLALDFNLDYDELQGSSKGRRVVTFIEEMVRVGTIVEFIERCQEIRPRSNYQTFLETARQNPEAFELRSSEKQKGSPETAVYQALNKALGLIEAQSNKIEQLTRPHESASHYAPEQMRVSKEAFSQTNKSWEKNNKIGSGISSSTTSPDKFRSTTEQTARKSPEEGKLHGEIEQLEAHISEEIEGLLASIRQRIDYLKEKLQEHQQMMQDESLRATKNSFGFQGKRKSDFPVGKSPFARK
ncbi:MAG: hypothetical protein DHS20C20_02480 [Ardenticatenaceae bacterium]|nr:MAG: hypothetical protein DHS20C20_02480 [Ardenticatenaceae bacterium]